MSARPLPFTPWPRELAARYRAAGYWTDRPMTDLVARAADAQAPAIFCGERSFSYGELDRLSTQLACALYRRGLRGGDTALVQLPNVAEFYLVFFALLKLGAAPVNALFSHRQLELDAYAEQLRPALLIGAAAQPLFRDGIFAQSLRGKIPELQLTLMLGETDYAENLADLLVETDPRFPAAETANNFAPSPADQVAFFQLSGGSTGTPKLIPRTHNDYYYSVRGSAEICRLNSATRFLCALPAAHNFPLSSPGALGVFCAGGAVVLAPSPEPGHCFRLIERHRVTLAALVPSAVLLWLEAAQQAHARAQLASLQLLQVGGASFAEATALRVPTELGCRLQQVFGMAEGLVNYTRLDDTPDRLFTTQGRPMSDADEVRVLDGDGRPVADGATGLLHTRGPYTFRGYFQAPQQNAQVFDRDGFYCSGDLVQRDADGYLRVVGRVKDQINRGGEKIAAEEVENLLLGHAGVTGAALVAAADARLGEKSCAFLVLSDPSLKAPALRRYLRELGLADYKLPDRFRFVDALPLTAVGKTDKVQLRRQLADSIA